MKSEAPGEGLLSQGGVWLITLGISEIREKDQQPLIELLSRLSIARLVAKRNRSRRAGCLIYVLVTACGDAWSNLHSFCPPSG